MNNTKQSFKDKWFENPHLAFSSTLSPEGIFFKWILKRNGFNDLNEFKNYLRSKKRILDAGCGNGRVTALIRESTNDEKTEIIGIDLVSVPVAKKNLRKYKNIKFYEKDLLGNIKSLGKFNFIYCQEVLHHTDNPLKAFLNLCELLDTGGEIAIYVYKKKAPVREFTDSFVSKKISGLSYKKAMQVCKQITQLGKTLSGYDFQFDIPQIDVLEIKKGKYTLQRFIYHFFMKCFWNSEMSFKDNTVLNYDWYHPQESSKHTLNEVKKWFEKANLKIVHEYTDFYGITIRGKNG